MKCLKLLISGLLLLFTWQQVKSATIMVRNNTKEQIRVTHVKQNRADSGVFVLAPGKDRVFQDVYYDKGDRILVTREAGIFGFSFLPRPKKRHKGHYDVIKLKDNGDYNVNIKAISRMKGIASYIVKPRRPEKKWSSRKKEKKHISEEKGKKELEEYRRLLEERREGEKRWANQMMGEKRRKQVEEETKEGIERSKQRRLDRFAKREKWDQRERSQDWVFQNELEREDLKRRTRGPVHRELLKNIKN